VLKMFPKTHITIVAAATVVVTAAILMSPSADVEAKRMSYTVDLEQGIASEVNREKSSQKPDATLTPRASTDPTLAKASPEMTPEAASEVQTTVEPNSKPEARLTWQSFDIKSGDTLSAMFKKAGFNDGIMLSVIHGAGDAKTLQRLYVGETIRFATNSQDELAAVELKRSLLETLKITKQDDAFDGQTEIRVPESKPVYASGTVNGSLYTSARKVGLNDRLTMELSGIFGWDIDFVYDVRKGDQFEVVYEELYVDGEKFGTGRILSARFVNRGKESVAVLYTDSKGDSDYYTPEGNSVRKAFLRTPLNARISSPFNLQRRHPVLDVVRPHEGTDYAAPPGTPIKASGNGIVRSAGWKGGYGRTVVLKHGDNITTLYAHMSRINKKMKSGLRVKQGDTIGYVGSSGMVTGPHLHYEFRVNGSPRNSRTVKLPDAQPIPASEMARFNKITGQQVAQFEAFRNNYQHLALASED